MGGGVCMVKHWGLGMVKHWGLGMENHWGLGMENHWGFRYGEPLRVQVWRTTEV